MMRTETSEPGEYAAEDAQIAAVDAARKPKTSADPFAHVCKPPRAMRNGLKVPLGVNWRCRCGHKFRMEASGWVRTTRKG